MVESSSSGGRGAEEGIPPPRIADVIDRQESIMQGMFSHTGTLQGEKGQLQSIQDHDVPEPCDKTTTQPCGTKLPNGHGGHSAHKLTEWDDPNSSLPAGSYLNSEGDHVIANGELSAGSRGGALDAISSVLPPQDAAVDRTTSSEDYLNAQNAVFNDTRSCSEGDPSLDRNSSASRHSVVSPVKLMVESSSSGGRGAEEGIPPPRIADVIDRQESIMQGMFSHTGTSQGEKGQLQSIQDHDVPESCDKTTTQPCGTKLPNGHGGHSAHKLTEWDDPNSSLPAGSYFNSEGDHVIANGELSAGSRGGALDAISSVLPPQDAAVDRTTSSEDYLNAQNAVFNDTRSCSEGDPSLDRNSSASLSTPKHSLRTFSSSTFLNTDSARLSRYDDETFSTSDRPDDSIFTDVSLKPRNTYEISRRQSAPDNIPGVLSVAVADLTLSQRKQGISEIFNRSLFSRKQREAHSAPGWKLFGKVPLRESPPKDSKIIQQESNPGNLTSVSTPNLLNSGEYEARASKSDQSPSLPTQGRRKNLEFEPLSTTALILEDRPASLPAKSEEEAQRHRQEYDEMVAEAKKRELKEAQKKKKQMKERFKQEESIANAMVVWNNEILPNWESMRGTRRVRDLWWQGLPPNVRGKVWSLAIGNELNITSGCDSVEAADPNKVGTEPSFKSKCFVNPSLNSLRLEKQPSILMSKLWYCVIADSADRESSLDLIKLDISRTFPPLFIFQKGGPYHDLLHSLLGAYTCYRPDVGYVQGMSFIAAVLILNLEEADAFIAFANLLNKPCQMAFFRVDHELMLKYFAAFEVFFEENLPRLFNHFKSYNLTPDLYLIDWIFTLYTKSLPLDVACRVWDVFCRDGEEFLFRTGLGILRLYEDVLLQMDFIHIAQFLTRLPEDTPSERLLSCIANTQMISSNRKWAQVFNALIKDKEMEKSISPTVKTS
ncbi:TBC1 domain family member 12-like [Sinocyclocheilus grahami]|uniref:TBC1 domain family member 12-like n=1 Tax=Sinocyclocheilus grahami TaxID=75366 RepID=UPI0007AD41DB|nr:PREDICTED: TBC1 domain family member 12-like [Sinocyclocheilus grahami]